ncbi:substrate-binding periplasmic protein [Chitinimonas sp. PSY-7]|uniref:substrate-binding periplasmic protein n=1 Tax=Chitinimonas sp. PSY-7 TaxID=3459088 RepID=UPI0040401A8B
MKLHPFLGFSWAILSAQVLASSPTKTVSLLVPEQHDSKGQLVPLSPRQQKLIELISIESGLYFNVKAYPWRRAQRLAQLGYGLIWGVIKTQERSKYFKFSAPIATLNHWLVVPTGYAFPYRNIQSLSGMRVVIANGDLYGDEFDTNRNKLFSVEEEAFSREARLTMLAKGRADVALIGSFHTAAKQFEARLNYLHGDIGDWTVLPKPQSTAPIHIAAPLDHPLSHHLPTINQAISRLRQRGAIQAAISIQETKSDNIQPLSESYRFNKHQEDGYVMGR